MSDGLGRGGTTSKRSPPRQAEDRDSTVVLRSTRGTGLPPRILSSGRGRGASRGGGTRAWPVVRPQSGSVPPWANRSKTVDTYISSRPSFIDEERVEAGSRHMSRKEPPTQPKWDRERSRTPLQYHRMMSSSLPSGSRPNTGATSGYSSGPSHQRWMAPEDQAGPSRYSVPEPQEEREIAIESAPSSSSTTSRAQSQSYSNPPDATNAGPQSVRGETETDVTGSSRVVTRQPSPLVYPNTETIQDEKDDMQMDTPGAGPSRSPEPAKEAESLGKDVKPDLSTLEGAEVPSIADEDRQDGVLAVKRSLVLQCYEKNVAIRTAARKAFRVQKTAELAAVGRIVQHVLWRDDGVGVQWIKARNRASPKKPATVPTDPTLGTPITIDPSPPGQAASLEPRQPTRPSTLPPTQPTIPDRAKTPPIIVKLEASSAIKPSPSQPPHHALPPKPCPNLPAPAAQSKPSLARPGTIKPAVVPDDSSALSDKQKGKRPAGVDSDHTKRKAADDTPEVDSSKPAKLPKVDSTARHQLSSEEFRVLSKSEKKALKYKIEAERKELVARHGANGVDFKLKKVKKSASERKKIRKERERLKEEEDRNRLPAPHQVTEGIAKGATEAVSTVVKSSDVPQSSKSIPATTSHSAGRRGENSTGNPTIKTAGGAKRVIDLSDDTTVNGSANAGNPKDKSKGKAREIVDLTKDSSNDKPNPPLARNPVKAATTSSTAPKAAKPATTSSVLRPSVPTGPTVRPSTVRPPIPPTAPVRPGVRPSTTASVRPSASNVIPRPLSFNSSAARPPSYPSIGRPPQSTTVARPPASTSSAARPPSGALGRPSQPRTITLRIPSDSSDITRPTAHPQYQAPAGQSSYSERQALAALARPPIGQPVRPAGTKFLPRTAATIQARPPASTAPLGGKASASTDVNQTRSIHRSSTLSSSSPLGGSDMLPSRSLTPAVTTPRYKELRRLLSEKMEEMDNWTSMLVDLPDRAEMTQRQIDRTRQECFVLQKQMRDEKDKAGP